MSAYNMTIIFWFPLTFPYYMGLEKYLKELGNHIRKLRDDRHITQSELARLVDKDRQTIHKLEKGKLNATVESLKQIADALKIPMKKLFDFE